MVDSLLLAAAASGILIYGQERLIVPGTLPVHKRPFSAHAVHWGLSLLMLLVPGVILARPWFALLLVNAFVFLVVMVNNAKFHSLREPFIAQDFEYFTDAIRHPRLYLPFLGWWRALAAALGGGIAIWSGYAIEKPLSQAVGFAQFVLESALLLVLALALLALGNHSLPRASYNPVLDLRRLGLLASLWRYGRDEREPWPDLEPLPPLPDQRFGRADLVVVQSESFFDARRCYPGLRTGLFPELDRLRRDATAFGELEVPAWGANTVRSEFSFLAGAAPDRLGVHQFNPYRRLPVTGLATLASRLRDAGYRTVCIHPYPASFYRREIVFPRLGFDEFVDISAFRGAERFGPYIGDLAVAEKLEELLAAHHASSEKPIFVYVITMENHGPLHLEKVEDGDIETLFSQLPPDGCDDLTIYARHLVNADRMFGALRKQLAASPREGILCLFGDHVPIMPAVYRMLGEPDGRTDYLIWRNRRQVAGESAARAKVEELAGRLLRELA